MSGTFKIGSEYGAGAELGNPGVRTRGDTVSATTADVPANLMLGQSNLLEEISRVSGLDVLPGVVGASNVAAGNLEVDRHVTSGVLRVDQGGTARSNLEEGRLLFGEPVQEFQSLAVTGYGIVFDGVFQVGTVDLYADTDVFGGVALFARKVDGSVFNITHPGASPPSCTLELASAGSDSVQITATVVTGFPVEAFFSWEENRTAPFTAAELVQGNTLRFRGDSVSVTARHLSPAQEYVFAVVLRDARGVVSPVVNAAIMI